MVSDRKAQGGFTLIEFVVAATFLAVVVVAVGNALDTIRYVNSEANNLTVASAVAQQQLEKYRNVPFGNITVGTSDISSVLSAYPSLGSPRSATATVTQVDSRGLDQVDVKIKYTTRGGVKTVEVTTQVSYKGINK